MTAQILVVTGTSTDIGKTVATAAVAACARAARLRVGVCKPVQTGLAPGEPGDLAEVQRLVGPLPTREPARFADPLAPETAAVRSGTPPVTIHEIVAAIDDLAAEADLVLVEGAGGVLVRLAPDLTVLDIARRTGADLLIVTDPGLGTLNHTELTVTAARASGVGVRGLILGRWPDDPDLAMTCNRADLPRLTGVPILGTVPSGAGRLGRSEFCAHAPRWIDRRLLAR